MTKSFQIISDLISHLQEILSLKSATYFFELVFSWKKLRPDIMDNPREQQKVLTFLFDDCWTYALSRGQSSLVKLHGSSRKPLTRKALKKGVDFRYKTDHPDYADFENLLKKLLAKGPVVVTIDVLPSYLEFDGEGVYCPTDVDCEVRKFEKFNTHNLLATGHGVEVRRGRVIEFVEAQDSQGEVGMSNLHKNITIDHVKRFFEPIGVVDEVKIHPSILDDGNGGKMKQGSVKFKSPSVMENALKLKWELLLDRPINLAPLGNGRETYFISGYNKDLSVDDIKQQIRNHFKYCGTIWKFFFPKNSDNGSYLGFCYILLEFDRTTLKHNADVVDMDLTVMEGCEIRVRSATMKTRVLRTEMA